MQHQLNDGVVLQLAHADDLGCRCDNDPKNGVGKQVSHGDSMKGLG